MQQLFYLRGSRQWRQRLLLFFFLLFSPFFAQDKRRRLLTFVVSLVTQYFATVLCSFFTYFFCKQKSLPLGLTLQGFRGWADWDNVAFIDPPSPYGAIKEERCRDEGGYLRIVSRGEKREN